MDRKKRSGKLRSEPTAEELREMEHEFEQRCVERLAAYRDCRALAAEAFRTTGPNFEMVSGIREILDSGVERETVAPVMARAIEEAGKLGATETSDVLALFGVLLDDEKAEEHLATAAAAAKELFGEASKDALDLYFEVYGVDDDPDALVE